MKEQSIFALWQMVISRKSLGTALSYREAMLRFQKDNGHHIVWEDITPEFIDRWAARMYQCNLTKTTVNIYLRSLSAILHVAYEMQYLQVMPKFLFRGLGIFSHNSSNSRKHCYIPTSEWRKLWAFFECSGRGYKGVEQWTKEKQNSCIAAVGLMLFMYLANGMNLCDVCRLRYNKFYFQSGGKQLQFCRHKTEARTGVTVEIPILHEMQVIIDRLGQSPEDDKLIFPYLNNCNGDVHSEYLKVANLGHLVRDRMQDAAAVLQFPCCPTPTWARHSFATNLVQAGVPRDYVSWAMAHVTSDVTSRYIAAYSYEQMLRYNCLLLHEQNTCDYLLAQAKCLPKEEQLQLLKSLCEIP